MKNFHRIRRVVKSLFAFGAASVGYATTVLASAAGYGERDAEDEGDVAGVYNFRTRKFDNGTDPYGWYEEDL